MLDLVEGASTRSLAPLGGPEQYVDSVVNNITISQTLH